MHGRQAARVGAVTLFASAGMIMAAVFGSPAWAHVEVSADNPQAGARNVTITFTGEAESDSAGIISERVILPAGISPQAVHLVQAPAGWALTSTADGYTVSGAALPIGQDAVYSITVAQLPTDATELPFKTLETYSDGKISRWIQIPQAGAPEPDNPAPVLRLKPAGPPDGVANPAPRSSTGPTPAQPTTSGAGR